MSGRRAIGPGRAGITSGYLAVRSLYVLGIDGLPITGRRETATVLATGSRYRIAVVTVTETTNGTTSGTMKTSAITMMTGVKSITARATRSGVIFAHQARQKKAIADILKYWNDSGALARLPSFQSTPGM